MNQILEHILAGTYHEKDMVAEMEALIKCFKNIMSLFSDQLIADYNQIFTRDIVLSLMVFY
jgi:hypothetical protein